MEFYFVALYFFVYGFLGWCTEVAFAACKEHRFVNRGFLNGPFCPIYGFGVSLVIIFLTPYRSNILLLYVASVLVVTLLEGLTGWAMDKIFHNKWWDYSGMPLNIGGYVCLLFSLIWGVACVAIMNLIHPLIHKGLAFLPQPLGITLIVILSILIIVDTCVTSSAIFKFNRQLEHMEKIAAELHELSEQLGENIYATTTRAMEAADEIQDTIEELKDRGQDTIEELKERTQDAVEEFHEKRQDMVDNMQEKAQDMVDNMQEKAQDMVDNMQEKAQGAVEELYEKGQDTAESIRAHITDMKKRYSELNQSTGRVTKRLLRAFPSMEPRQHKERVMEIRRQLHEKLKK